MVTVKAQNLEIIELRLKNIKDGVPKVVVKAINKTLPIIEKKLLEKATERYGIKSRYLKRDIKKVVATRNYMKGYIDVKGKRHMLHHFKFSGTIPSVKGKRVNISILKGEKKNMGGSTFLFGNKNGDPIIVKHNEGSTHRNGFKALFGLSTPQMTGSEKLKKPINDEIEEVLDSEMEKETNRLLKGGG